MATLVAIKEEPSEENIEEEEVATYSIEVSAEAAADAQVKLEEMFNWSNQEDADDDGNNRF